MMQDNTKKELTVKSSFKINLKHVIDEVIDIHLNNEYTLMFEEYTNAISV